MKKILIAAICVLAGVALFLHFNSHQATPLADNPSAPESSIAKNAPPSNVRPAGAAANSAPAAMAAGITNSAAPPASTSPSPQDVSALAGGFVPGTNGSLNLPPETVLRNLRRAVHQYGDMFGGDPVGTNPEITAALMGKNPRQINFLTGQDGMSVNNQGELVDAWGTPYFFHQLSGTDMEIHSAGPDRKMWTSDDIVTR